MFCHTPHGSNTDVSAPLWNKANPTTTYQRYSDLGTATLDGTEVTVGEKEYLILRESDILAKVVK